jgi:DNA polymerase-1
MFTDCFYCSIGRRHGKAFTTDKTDILGADRDELWDIILMAYGSKGLTEDDAILQARMAHILRATSYNFKTKKIRLWQPFWLDD